MKTLLAVFGLILLASCGGVTEPNQTLTPTPTLVSKPLKRPTGDLHPLSVGNRWKYLEVQKAPDKETETSIIEGAVVEMGGFNEKVWYKYVEGDNWMWYRNTPEGLIQADVQEPRDRSDTVDEKYYLKLPPPGEVSLDPYVFFYGEVVELISTDTQVETEAGKFSCYHYRITGKLEVNHGLEAVEYKDYTYELIAKLPKKAELV
jgi:hypothetical protein